MMTGLALGVPIVYARKHRPITMQEPVYVESAPSHTKGGAVFPIVKELGVPIRFLGTGEKLGDLVEFNAREYVDALF